MANKNAYPRERTNPLVLIVAVAVAAVIGLALVLIVVRAPASSSAAAASSPTYGAQSTQGTQGTEGTNGGLAPLPPLGGNGGGLQYMLNGKVTAISSTSITLSGNGPSVTAAINGSTRVTGSVTGVGGIKVGDQVTAQVGGQSGTSLVASAIQDPAQGP